MPGIFFTNTGCPAYPGATMNGPPARRCSGIGLLLLALLLVACAAVHLGRLDHAYLPGWDEAVHAAVAGNLAEHPLTPTLFDDPLLPLNPANWQANHVWLHMPPLPFWQAALSLRLLGRGFFALRLPGLLLFLLTLAGVYLLGVRLAGEAEGLLAALLLLVNGLRPSWLGGLPSRLAPLARPLRAGTTLATLALVLLLSIYLIVRLSLPASV